MKTTEPGGLHIRMDDAPEFDSKPGDVYFILAGHDAWTVGNEPAVVGFQGMGTTRKPAGTAPQAGGAGFLIDARMFHVHLNRYAD